MPCSPQYIPFVPACGVGDSNSPSKLLGAPTFQIIADDRRTKPVKNQVTTTVVLSIALATAVRGRAVKEKLKFFNIKFFEVLLFEAYYRDTLSSAYIAKQMVGLVRP